TNITISVCYCCCTGLASDSRVFDASHPMMESTDIPEAFFPKGKCFNSYQDILDAVSRYEKKRSIALAKQDCRRIENDNRRPSTINKYANVELVYSELYYRCVHGGSYKKRVKKNTSSELDTINDNGIKKRKTKQHHIILRVNVNRVI
ncbi:unnamed protein product, partial [Meganyctiphanes norvegica]